MNNRGVALIITYMVVAVLTILSAAFLARAISEKDSARRNAYSTHALWLAEAGIQKAIWELNSNNCADFKQCILQSVCSSCSACSSVSKCLTGTLTYGDFSAQVDSLNTTITSTGYYPSSSDSNLMQRTVTVYLASDSPFNYGVFAKGSIGLSENVTIDSYDSSKGNYGGSNVKSNGDLGTNSTSDEAIELSNNVTVKGDVSTGSGGTVDSGENVTVTGSTTHDNNIDVPSVSVPSSLSSLTSGGALSVAKKDTTTLSAGSYKYTSITLGEKSTLSITGAVNLYLTSTSSALTSTNNGTISIASGASLTVYVNGVVAFDNNVTINNSSKTPSNFVLYSTYSGSNGVTVENNGGMYGVVYAPDTDVSISNNGIVYGAVIGKTIEASNNAYVHYDEKVTALASSSSSSYTMSNWQEPTS